MEGFYYNRDTVFFDNPVTSLRIPVTWMITRKPTWNIISCHFSTIKVREVQLSLLRFKVNDKFSWRQILFVSLYLLLAKGLSKIKQQNQNIVTDERRLILIKFVRKWLFYTLQIVHLPKCKTGKNIAIDRLTVYLFCSETSSH